MLPVVTRRMPTYRRFVFTDAESVQELTDSFAGFEEWQRPHLGEVTDELLQIGNPEHGLMDYPSGSVLVLEYGPNGGAIIVDTYGSLADAIPAWAEVL